MKLFTAATHLHLHDAYKKDVKFVRVYFHRNEDTNVSLSSLDAKYALSKVHGGWVMKSHQTNKDYDLNQQNVPDSLAGMQELRANGCTTGETFAECFRLGHTTKRNEKMAVRILRHECQNNEVTLEEFAPPTNPDLVPPVTPSANAAQSPNEKEALMKCLTAMTETNLTISEKIEGLHMGVVECKKGLSDQGSRITKLEKDEGVAECKAELSDQGSRIAKLEKEMNRMSMGNEPMMSDTESDTESAPLSSSRNASSAPSDANININAGANSTVATAFGTTHHHQKEQVFPAPVGGSVPSSKVDSFVSKSTTPISAFTFGAPARASTADTATCAMFSVGISDKKAPPRKSMTIEQRRHAWKGKLLASKSKTHNHKSRTYSRTKGEPKSLKARRKKIDHVRNSPAPVKRNLFPVPFNFMPEAN